MSGELWVPGARGPAPEAELVERIHRQIEQFGANAAAEVELRDGELYRLESITPEPGYGFVTLRPHGEGPSEVIVPLGAIGRITIRPARDEPPFGFSLPAA